MNIFVRIFIPILVLIAGVFGAFVLASSAKKEEQVDVPSTAIAVSVIDVSLQEQQAEIKANGIIQASKQVSLSPQVGGKINFVDEGLQPGARFTKGAVLARIESKDYQLGVEQERSRLEKAQLDLKVEIQRQQAAQREWELLGNEGKASELASRQPQLELAKLNVEAAKAAMKRAELSLSRTAIKAPFDCMIRNEQVEEGQVVAMGTPLMTLVGTEQYWVRVAVPTSKLGLIDIPDVTGTQGSATTISNSLDGGAFAGKVIRMEAELDQQSRTAHLLIAIDAPLAGEGMPLVIGSYTDVHIQGRKIPQGVRIPTSALIDGTYVLIADQENRLARKDVEIAWREQKEVVVKSGLEIGDRVITTSISMPIYGSALNIQPEGSVE